MKVVNYRIPNSSFLSVEKDLGITDAILKNKNLQKLLPYHSKSFEHARFNRRRSCWFDW